MSKQPNAKIYFKGLGKETDKSNTMANEQGESLHKGSIISYVYTSGMFYENGVYIEKYVLANYSEASVNKQNNVISDSVFYF